MTFTRNLNSCGSTLVLQPLLVLRGSYVSKFFEEKFVLTIGLEIQRLNLIQWFYK